MELAYHNGTPMSPSDYNKKVRQLPLEYEAAKENETPSIVPLNKGFALHLFRRFIGGAIYVFVVQDKVVLGCVELWEDTPGPYTAKFKAARQFRAPHSTIDPRARGQGLAQIIYEFALKQGYILFTQGHTLQASLLWDRLGNTWSGGLLYYDKAQQQVRAPLSKVEQKEAFRFLLGTGRSYRDVIPLGWTALMRE